MASIQSKMINLSLKKLVQIYFTPELNIKKLRSDDYKKPSTPAKRHCHSEEFQIGNVTGSWLIPKKYKTGKTILYFHGGAYVCGPSILQWRMLAQIARETGHSGLLINYRVAPEYPYPSGLLDMEAAYEYLLEENEADDIIFMGDSAGGGLALALAIKLRDEQKPLPGKLVLLSPWLDLNMSNREIPEQAKLDNMLALPGLKEAADLYCGDNDKTIPYISPLKDSLKGLPPAQLLIGTNETLLPDCRLLKKKAETIGWELEYEEWEDMFHVWMLNVPYLREAKEAVKNIVEFLN